MEEEYNTQVILNNLKSSDVYKDECVRCFVENTSEEGVNVCLRTFEGFCKEHLTEYVAKTGNKVFLNYKVRVEKIKPENDAKPQKITKLAIGVEGGIDVNNEKRTTVCKVFKTDEESFKLADSEKLIAGIQAIDSSYKKTQVTAWEQDIKECDHVRALTQEIGEKLSKEKLAKCASCDLTDNLWLNLATGHVGCGRRNFDGSGGNGHALEYYNSTSHPVCVKSGTISPEGNASVFCYQCDDDVKVNKLPEFLETIGLDVCSMVKTEKTMMELNLELNLTFTLSAAYEKGKKLELITGPGLTGLENIGNSCYLNAVIQCLMNIPEFKQRYFTAGQEFLSKTKRQASTCFLSQMSKLCHGIWSGQFGRIYSEEIEVPLTGEKTTNQYQDGIKPYMFRHMVGKGHQEFSTNRQQDSMEYLIHVLSILDKHEKNFKLEQTSNLFKFTLETRITDTTAPGKVKINEIDSKFIKVSLPKPDKFGTWTQKTPVEDQKYTCNIQDVLNIFTSPTAVTNSTKIKQTGLKNFPKYLIIQTENFLLNGWVPMKLHCDVQFANDSEVDLKALKLPAPEGLEIIEDDEEDTINVDEAGLAQLMSMGFSKNRCTRALVECGNNVENSVNYIFSTMDDASLDEPITKKKKKTGGSGGDSVTKLFEQVWPNAQMMGLAEDIVRAACEIKTNPDQVIGYCFENQLELQKIIDEKKNTKAEFPETLVIPEPSETNSKYDVIGAVVHLGKSIHVGHYVCYVKKEGKWIYINDSKVAKSIDPDIGQGFIYILKRKDS